MRNNIVRFFIVGLLGIFLFLGMSGKYAFAADAVTITRDAEEALEELYESNPYARALGRKAKGILIFPEIVKGGFIIGGQYGNGALIKGGRVDAYYRSFAASYGLQAGIQKFGYVLFFMTYDDLDYLDRSDGWEIGVGPSLVLVDEGMAKNMTTTTLKKGVYAFIFGQKGLMAGLGIQGTKITEIYPL